MQHLSNADKLCCPQCGHRFLASEQKLEQPVSVPGIIGPVFNRKDALTTVRNGVASGLKATGKAWFSNVRVTTNDDTNLGTPIAATVHFRDGKTRTARAGVLQPNIDLFVKSALADIIKWADLVYGGTTSPAD